jgi:hypothetical protein
MVGGLGVEAEGEGAEDGPHGGAQRGPLAAGARGGAVALPRGRERQGAPMVRITVTSTDGEERDEDWASVERFLAWARAEGLRGAWSAYEPDGDGEWLLVARGRI